MWRASCTSPASVRSPPFCASSQNRDGGTCAIDRAPMPAIDTRVPKRRDHAPLSERNAASWRAGFRRSTAIRS
jgi:hypothetical protein